MRLSMGSKYPPETLLLPAGVLEILVPSELLAERPQSAVPTAARLARSPWIWLIVSLPLLPFANGRWSIPFIAWIAGIFFLRFYRNATGKLAWLAAVLSLSIAWGIQLWRMAPLWWWLYILLALASGLTISLLYSLDRHFATPLRDRAISTLVFPCACVTIELLMTRETPYGSWGSPAYTQYGNLPLLQLLSLTGIYGISFLIAWLASTVNWIWEKDFDWRRVRGMVFTYVGVLAAVLLYGGARIAFFPPSAPTVRIASLSRLHRPFHPDPVVEDRALMGGQVGDADLALMRDGMRKNWQFLLDGADREAAAGAKIVFWAEADAPIYEEDEPELISAGQKLARRRQIFLGMALATLTRGKAKPLENKLVLIAPDGSIAYEYRKVRPLPGPEAWISWPGDYVRFADTPYGRISSVICFDADFPDLLKQVEQGVNLVRQVDAGLSMAVDYQGRPLAYMDFYRVRADVMTAEVPTRGVRTIYSCIGDAFAFLCIGGLLALTALSIRARRVHS